MLNLIKISRGFSFKTQNIERKAFGVVEDRDIQYFKSFLQGKQIITDPHEIEPYNLEFRKNYKGRSQLVLSPKTTEEVAKILRHCNERRLAVVPQGGNTGLVGGSVPVFD
jgi:FAD/FMN-containing dehydrogenase